ncbi:MAG: hypothetical protein ACC650_02685 [Gammaproteobacteria bacterium]
MKITIRTILARAFAMAFAGTAPINVLAENTNSYANMPPDARDVMR